MNFIAQTHGSKSEKSKRHGKQLSKEKTTLERDRSLIDAYAVMFRARALDEKAIVLYKQNKCHFQIGCAGHEAVGVAAAKVFKAGKDWFYPYYRDLALVVALGMSDREIMLSNLNKEDDPNSHGRMMPNHYGHKKLRVVAQSSPTGTQFCQAVGMALAIKYKKAKEVVYVSAGEGACAQGDFHEALNWAAREKLPIVFMIQNNGFAISVPVSDQIPGKSVAKMVSGYAGLTSFEVDGSNYGETLKVISKAYQQAANGQGPALVEAYMARLQSHSISDNHLKYRTERELAAEKKLCPIGSLREQLLKEKIISTDKIKTLEEKIKKEIDLAAEWAETQPFPKEQDLEESNYNDPYPWLKIEEKQTESGEELFLVDALNKVLDQEMKKNPEIIVFGQDVAGGKGGVFTVTSNLTTKHGKERCFNTQLAESSIAGVAIGAATYGIKPIAEIQFGDYIWTAMMQIRNELAQIRFRSNGDFSAPAVIRVPVGGYIHGGLYHSQNIEATFAHFPGLYIAYPSNATDAAGLLRTAIRMNDPVLFLEHKGLYRQVYAKGVIGNDNWMLPFGKAKVVRSGNSATIVTWGALVNKALTVAKEAAEKMGAEIEVIDLRTILPLDFETIANSLMKTSRVLIAHEDTAFMGFGAEIAAQISENCFTWLDAPVKRVAALDVAGIPHAGNLEKFVLPQNETLYQALEELLKF
ncbi:MAG TPA: dehydrogenase E1 component subunit alpha/beta [Oligoflexia bacterium]|nr:dehydrogenase E1 component subunit alpha/beta [Oligoflexia bacterium]HMP26383.1 dehydrogenase E1 component subunit alpha/beta [Oligoflexia bacterium]